MRLYIRLDDIEISLLRLWMAALECGCITPSMHFSVYHIVTPNNLFSPRQTSCNPRSSAALYSTPFSTSVSLPINLFIFLPVMFHHSLLFGLINGEHWAAMHCAYEVSSH
jgi:hypothetical protein